ncbi:phage major capsid protein [Sinorhizobium meliloti]|nr:phage major capsid protein [Sinorhizobium meliloti]
MKDLLFRAARQSENDPSEYILSDETVDRYGDVIMASGWDLRHFGKSGNPIALFNHHSDEIIGVWENVRVEGRRLLGKLKLADEGTSPTVDKVRRLIKQGILKTVSVGFHAIEKEPLNDKADPFWGPFRYLKQELVECSVVSVPANPNAQQLSLRSMGLPQLPTVVTEQLFGKVANQEERRSVRSAFGEVATVPPVPGTKPMKISEKIKGVQTHLNALRDQLNALVNQDYDDLGEEDVTLLENLPAEIDAAEKRLKNLEAAERALVPLTMRQQPSEDGNEPPNHAAPAVITEQPARLYTSGPKKLRPSDLLVRQYACQFLAHVNKTSPIQIQQRMYGRDEALAWAVKAAVNPAMTTVPDWAGDLAQEAIADFMDLLRPVSIYPQLANRGVRITFGANGSIRIPSRLANPNLAGSFIAEGDPIPVRRLGLTSIVLTPKKMAVISTFTREMAMHSTPQIETLIRDAMVEDTAMVIDTILLDANPATTTRPAGLLNGATAVTPTDETDPLAMMADIKKLISAIITNTGGRVRNIVVLINPRQALAIVTQQTTTGDFVFEGLAELGNRVNISFIESGAVPDMTVVALDASDFVTVTGDTPEFDVSDQATLHMEDTAPLPIVGGGATPVTASPVRSLWQTASIGIRMIWDMNWAMRRPGMVSYVENVTW